MRLDNSPRDRIFIGVSGISSMQPRNMTGMIQIELKTVPEVLKTTRMLAGKTVREMGALIGVSHGTISAWERGEGEPKLTQFLRWAHVTNQPADQLIDGLSDFARPEGFEPPTFWSVARSLELAHLWASLDSNEPFVDSNPAGSGSNPHRAVEG